MPTYVNDLGTWRKLRYIHVNDLGAWRSIKYAWVNDLGTWRRVFRRDHAFTLTAGNSGAGGVGYIASSYGSISSATLDDGSFIQVLNSATPGPFLTLTISGFGGNPGQSYFTNLVIESTTFTSVSASYSYGSGFASWQWGPQSPPFSDGATHSVRLEF